MFAFVLYMKAESFGTKQISEDDLLDLIRTRPKGKAQDMPKNGSGKARKRSRSPDKATLSPTSKKACLTINLESPPRDEPKAQCSSPTEDVSQLQKNSKVRTSRGKISPIDVMTICGLTKMYFRKAARRRHRPKQVPVLVKFLLLGRHHRLKKTNQKLKVRDHQKKIFQNRKQILRYNESKRTSVIYQWHQMINRKYISE